MYYLTKTAGLDLAMYEGELKDGSREGHGMQYFPNGYKFTGMWKQNKANGQGKLEYTDGTYYEGLYKDNRIVEGLVYFCTGAKFVGTFEGSERHRDRFLEGSFFFINGDVLKTVWSQGVPKSGQFITKSGRILPFSNTERAIYIDEDDPTTGKIILSNSTEIYEGGVKEKGMNSKGVIYSSFPHYEEVFHMNGQLDGNYTCNYIHGGYCYSGTFRMGQRTGKWKYQTVKGYFFEGEPNFKSGTISFPYLNEDNFKGEVDVQFQNIAFRIGTYNFKDGSGRYKQIPVSNVKSLYDIAEVSRRKAEQPMIKAAFQKSKIVNEEPVLNGINIYYYPDGSYFRGNFTYDFIYIHKKELPNCYFTKSSGAARRQTGQTNFQTTSNFTFTQSKASPLELSEELVHKTDFFSGNKVMGKRNGFCKLLDQKTGLFQGLYVQGQRSGPGKLWGREGEVYTGTFVDDRLEGNCMVFLANGDIVQTRFLAGVPTEQPATITKRNGLVYRGEMRNFRKHGKGELTYTNGFKFVGDFAEGEIDTCEHSGVLVNIEGQRFACDYTGVAGRNMGILETLEGGDVYVYSTAQGSLKKAQ